jgi:hypothetical protein
MKLAQKRSLSAVMKNSKTIVVKSVKYSVLEDFFVSMGGNCSIVRSNYIKYDIPKYKINFKISDIGDNECKILCSNSKFTHQVADMINLLPEEYTILGKIFSEQLM